MHNILYVSSKSSDEEKMFLARVKWLPVTSRSHGRHITDKCKISIMMIENNVFVACMHNYYAHVYIQHNMK